MTSGIRWGTIAPPIGDDNIEAKATPSGAEESPLWDPAAEGGAGGWVHVTTAAIATLGGPGAGVSSFNARNGAVVPAAGDYATNQITNTRTVAGATTEDALDQLKSDIAGGGGVTDHGALTGLDGDDHNTGANAYHTDARGDARYYTQSVADALLAGKSATGHDHDAAYTPLAHATDTANPHAVTKAQVGLDLVANLRNNFASASEPGVNFDSVAGYAVGSRWFDTVADKAYTCLDAAAGAAVWREMAAMPLMVEHEYTASGTLTLAVGDYNYISANHASTPIVLTIPPFSSVAFPIGRTILIEQRGAAGVTITGGGGVTINKPSTKSLALTEQHSQAVLRKTAADTWVLGGELGSA
jgi:hypothetical protein